MNILKIAQILAGLLALALFAFSAIYIFNPTGAASARGFVPEGAYGLTNVRLMGATFLTLGILTAIGALKKEYMLVAPAALFFLVSIIIRVLGIIVDGADASTVRVMLPAIVLFIVAEVAVQVFKKAGKETSEVQTA